MRTVPEAAEETREFVISRRFNVPREAVYQAWTEADRLTQWWGPKGFSVRVARLELRPGGIFHYAMRTPDGHEMWGRFVYREIVPPERLVFVVSFSDAAAGIMRHPFAPEWPLEVLSTVTFAVENAGATLNLKGIPVNATGSERAIFEAGHESLRKGWTGTLDQLEAYLCKK